MVIGMHRMFTLGSFLSSQSWSMACCTLGARTETFTRSADSSANALIG